jgi:hypothetical protein
MVYGNEWLWTRTNVTNTLATFTFKLPRRRRLVFPKRRYLPARLHCVTFKKRVTLKVTTVRTPNSTKNPHRCVPTVAYSVRLRLADAILHAITKRPPLIYTEGKTVSQVQLWEKQTPCNTRRLALWEVTLILLYKWIPSLEPRYEVYRLRGYGWQACPVSYKWTISEKTKVTLEVTKTTTSQSALLTGSSSLPAPPSGEQQASISQTQHAQEGHKHQFVSFRKSKSGFQWKLVLANLQ